MQTLCVDGLKQSSKAERRFTAVRLHSLNEKALEGLIEQWQSWSTPEKAIHDLRADDCHVTNKSDKDEQLQKLQELCDGWAR
eukprot:CAMPEP_0174749972 /NCGR_PEP_ID=MMETSP1094-20130205/96811_1 /TAXON_ID=156173 /ORGANISM="Chrysochromulina brevifilum, Strain UTEX LB 985" /LENGTH=81 /DNA_ID=CAMNT_0015955255 /DNA_START=134 /DNA_END=376 /DNA_ORIENTATION=-